MTNSIARQGNITKVSEQYNVGTGGGLRATYDKVYLGFIKSTYDVMSMGRIKVYIPELCGNENDPNTWIPCDYASPFAGATDVTKTNKNANSGQTSYGMTFIPPDVNNQVLVMFINGDPNRGFWFACLFQVNANRMVPSTPGPEESEWLERNKLTGKTAICPKSTISNQDAGRSGELTSNGGAATKSLGTEGTNGNTSMGIRTPLGHSLVFEDNKDDGFVRLQTANTAQIMMHNNADRIIINTASGNSRIEMDREGNIDIITKKSLSVRSDEDINFSAKRDINISAQRNLNMQSYGETKILSQNKLHIKNINGGIFIQTDAEMHRIANGTIYDDSTKSIYRKAALGIYDTVTNGPYNLYVTGNIHQWAHTGTFDILSDSTMRINARGGGINIKSSIGLYISSDTGGLYLKSADDARIQSGGEIDLFAVNNVSVTSTKKDINIKSDTGSMFIQSVGNSNIKSGNSIIINGNDNVDLKPGRGSVRTTKSIIINEGTVPNAADATDANTSYTAGSAEKADPVPFPSQGAVSPEIKQHVNVYKTSNVTSGRTSEVVNSIVSRMPSADPSPTRTVVGPGFRKVVTRKDAPDESTFKIGEIFPNQKIPLQTIGLISGMGGGGVVGGVDSNVIQMVDSLKQTLGKNLVISSGFREESTPGVSGNPHATGKAVDISIGQSKLSDDDIRALTKAALSIGFTGIGIEGDHVHLDTAHSKLTLWGTDYHFGSAPNWAKQLTNWSNAGVGGGSVVSSNIPVTASQQNSTTSQIGMYTGKSWDSNKKPQYDYSPMPDAVFKPANEWTTTSDTGIASIQLHEGTGGQPPYRTGMVFPDACKTGKILIGHGHILTESEIKNKTIMVGNESVPITVDPEITTTVVESQGLSEDQMKTLLKNDLKPIEDKIKSAIGAMKITQRQFDALVDFVYNVGEDAFTQSGGVADLINAGKYNEVANEMIRWIIACGTERPELKTRRQDNALTWSGAVRSDVAAVSQTTGKAVDIASGPTAKSIYCYLTKNFGYSPAVACGFIGNFVAESSLNPSDGMDRGQIDANGNYLGSIVGPNPNGYGVGLVSWLNPRINNIRSNFSASGNFSATSITQQLEYVNWELTTPKGGHQSVMTRLNTVSDPITACDIINQDYEGSAGGLYEQNPSKYPQYAKWAEASIPGSPANRRANAQKAYDTFANDPNVCSTGANII